MNQVRTTILARMATSEGQNALIRELSKGGILDNNQLVRIENNPFILNDGNLPVCMFSLFWPHIIQIHCAETFIACNQKLFEEI